MSMTAPADVLMAGLEALHKGKWLDARSLLETAVARAEPGTREEAIARTGLSDALWWTSSLDDALAERERSYTIWRQLGDIGEAASTALWIGQEQYEGKADAERARAWLERVDALVDGDAPAWIAGQLLLFHAALDSTGGVETGRQAVELARAAHDSDLEALALSCLGMWHTMSGDVVSAAASFDEGMAIVSSGEVAPRMLAVIGGDLSYAIELWGEETAFTPWPETLRRLAMDVGNAPLMVSAVCCSGAYPDEAQRLSAEQELRAAIRELDARGHVGRRAMPVARLAELLLLQGRFDEAALVLGPGDYDDASTLVRARLALECGDPAVAATQAERTLRRLGGDSLATVPALELLLAAHLARGELAAADSVATRLEEATRDARTGPAQGRALLAKAQVLSAEGRTAEAVDAAERALDRLPTVGAGSTRLADAHLLLARLHADLTPGLAADEARAAIGLYARAGATHRADESAALLRALGERSGASRRSATPRHPDLPVALTEREREVLRLLATGLTNAEIARRLFISPKTAGNHVSSILTKLGLRSRVEATAYALAHPAR